MNYIRWLIRRYMATLCCHQTRGGRFGTKKWKAIFTASHIAVFGICATNNQATGELDVAQAASEMRSAAYDSLASYAPIEWVGCSNLQPPNSVMGSQIRI